MSTAAEELVASIETIEGDGAPETVSSDDLRLFKEEMTHISRNAGALVSERRRMSEETRFCIWEGQSPDGRKHRDALAGEEPHPYEGASDGRLRVADMIVNERALVLVAAGMRALAGIKAHGMEIRDEALGGRLTTVLQWVLKNQIGRKALRRELKKLANYQEGDAPAVGILGVWWEQEAGLKLQTVTVEELAQVLVETYGVDLAIANDALTALRDPEREEEAAEWVSETITAEFSTVLDVSEFTPKRAREIVKQLREDGAAEFPMPYWRRNAPCWTAYRLLEDIFLPANTPSDIQKARMVFIREWLSKPELEEREHSYGYSRSFIDEVLKHEGKTGFPAYRRTGVAGDGSLDVQSVEDTPDQNRGLYEVVTCLHRASNDSGVPGIYETVFSYHVDEAAKERELLDYQHGKYPLVEFARETINARLWDSRGVPELAMTDQDALKQLHDSFNDNAMLSSMPPFEVPMNRPKMRLAFGPLKQIKVNRPGEIKPLQMPAYPVGNDKHTQQIWHRVNQYFGRFVEDVLPMLQQLHQQGMADDFIDNLIEALDQTLALCQQFMTDEELQLVTGAKSALPVARSQEEIQGRYNIQLDFNVQTMDLAYIKELAEVIGTFILPIDTLSVTMRDKLVYWLMQAINPNLAEETLRPVEDASAQEVEDEQSNFAKIAAGVEPEMKPAGQNYQLRLETMMGIVQRNPEAYEKLSDISKQIFQARMKHLEAQVKQTRDNPIIGKRLGRPVLSEA